MSLLLKQLFKFLLLTVGIAVILYLIANHLLQSSIRQTIEAPNLAVFRALEAKLTPYPQQDWSRIIRKLQPATGSTMQVLPEQEIHLSPHQMQQLQQGEPITTLSDTIYYFGYGLSEAATYWQIGKSNVVLKITGMSMQSLVQPISSWMTHLMQLDLADTPRKNWPEKIQQMQTLYQLPLALISKTDSSIPISLGDAGFASTSEITKPGSFLRGRSFVSPLNSNSLYRSPSNLSRDFLRNNALTETSILKGERYIPAKIKQQLVQQEVVLGEANSRGNIETVYVKLHADNSILKIGPIPYPLLYPQYSSSLLIGTLLILVIVWIIAATLLFSRNLNTIYRLTKQYSQRDFSTPLRMNRHSSLHPLYRHLIRMGKQLEHSIESQQNLTRFVAHDCRTPISTMLFALHALEQETLSDTTRMQINSIKEDVSELSRLVDDFLHYARFSTKEFTLKRESVEIKNWLQSCVDSYQKAAQNISLLTHLPENYSFYFDPALMKQALSNLIHNAMKYGSTRIQISATQDIKHLIMQVEDNGTAIPDADKARIFQPFIRLEEESNTSHSGFGLGLVIAQAIVKQHKGEISVSDSKLGGACFTIILPVQF